MVSPGSTTAPVPSVTSQIFSPLACVRYSGESTGGRTSLRPEPSCGMLSGVASGGDTLTVNVSAAANPSASRTVRVMTADPVRPAAGVTVTVRSAPVPDSAIPESGTSPVSDEVGVTDSVAERGLVVGHRERHRPGVAARADAEVGHVRDRGRRVGRRGRGG